MAQNNDKKFDAASAQLLWLKENLYSRCREDTIHFSDLRENKVPNYQVVKKLQTFPKMLDRSSKPIEKYIANIRTWPGYLIFRSRVLAMDSSLIITIFSDGWYRDNFDPHGVQHTTNRMVLMKTQEIENVMSKNYINLVYRRR